MNEFELNDIHALRRDEFWQALDQLVSEHALVIDRPKGSRHPRYPQMVYPLDYGYLDGTTTVDGEGLDIFRGSLAGAQLTGLALTVDLLKRDVEIKLLAGCTAAQQQQLLDFLNSGQMRAICMRRPAAFAAGDPGG